MNKKFQPLDYSRGWDDYWRDHPQGYSPQEQMVNWAGQLNVMIDFFNEYFDVDLTEYATNVMEGWYFDGRLDEIINEVLFDSKADKTTVNSLIEKTNDMPVNVKMFGAIGDGIADDTFPFKTSIEYALNNKLNVLIPKGVYLINENINIPSGVCLSGEGVESKILLNNSFVGSDTAEIVTNITIKNLGFEFTEGTISGISPISFIDGDNITIENCYANSKTFGVNCIAFTSVLNSYIKNNRLENSGTGNGVTLIGCDNIVIEANTVYNSGRCGIQVFENNNSIKITNNHVKFWMLRRNLTDGGIDTYGPNNYNIMVKGNTLETGNFIGQDTTGSYTSIRLSGVINGVIEGNIINSTLEYVEQIILVQGRDEFLSDNIVVSNNVVNIKKPAQRVIRISNTKNTSVKGNSIVVEGEGQVIDATLDVRLACEHIDFSGNTLKLNNSSGNLFKLNSDVINLNSLTFSNNVATGFTQDAFIGLGAASIIKITNNILHSEHTRIAHIVYALRMILTSNYMTSKSANQITGEPTLEYVNLNNIMENTTII